MYIEINISNRPSKTGCKQEIIFDISDKIIKSPRLALVGINRTSWLGSV